MGWKEGLALALRVEEGDLVRSAGDPEGLGQPSVDSKETGTQPHLTDRCACRAVRRRGAGDRGGGLRPAVTTQHSLKPACWEDLPGGGPQHGERGVLAALPPSLRCRNRTGELPGSAHPQHSPHPTETRVLARQDTCENLHTSAPQGDPDMETCWSKRAAKRGQAPLTEVQAGKRAGGVVGWGGWGPRHTVIRASQ